MSDYTLTVGLEVHAELRTNTKMFCNSKNDADETRPNVNICPVCMGHPGTLPTINKEAVKHVLKVGRALDGTLANFTEFDRKNYFYPDIPKGYQISQYKFPLVSGGTLRNTAITRVHLEEDTATSLHDQGDFSLIDFNRAGVPLMELVTEPVIHSAKDAGDFARELQLLLRYLNVSNANMEKGEMRVEANISISKEAGVLGTKVEVKNLNSFRAVERAIAYEVARHTALLDAGEKIIQETRGWDEAGGKTFAQRRKEESHDYRYFPDPDLPKLRIDDISSFAQEVLQAEMPELPSSKRARYSALGMKSEDIETLVANRALGALFESASEILQDKDALLLAGNYLTSDLMGMSKKATKDADLDSFAFPPSGFAKLISMVVEKRLSSRGAKDILQFMFESGGDPEELAVQHDLIQKSDAGALETIVKKIIANNPKVVEDYKNGKDAALQFLVGQGMKATKGSANPGVLREVFLSLLS
ncbi:MAG: Asp-tRNA(Asn)/Glu-tRNA(Gln) amidotransferase GatCAB subunit B [Candidatus Taylorbacteria bacterium CG11_big_fil_rev_8_21_14_0_20_46_11]|uniref:Aspartyl/glutamyl-tRNA(Asn/Gln) amidotransferase subunit B n=1 Tax=Candidatus Taylorbacteria bacterium CG11_big_fil_rev_8_21_14_0_20_46_11 TaxID=1975025 RepID=A0A2H0KA19_9BACT|nr:MAG: Asp-tRNA(Asn)/Glu-tRNA(Gln) amidotransferase GatCAB subunit B [Candidatus Taylorbacteria bacterium CG11_big_fil_rev_8_21_14_0_20_46_11]